MLDRQSTLQSEVYRHTTKSDSEAREDDEVNVLLAEVEAATDRLAEEKIDLATDMVNEGLLPSGRWLQGDGWS